MGLGGERLRAGLAVEVHLFQAWAVQRRGLPRAPLIHEHHAAVAQDALERPLRNGEEIRRRLPRPAGDHQQRIGRRLFRQRIDDGNAQVDALAVGIARIQRNRDDPALRRRLAAPFVGGEEARREFHGCGKGRGEQNGRQPKSATNATHGQKRNPRSRRLS